MKIPDLKIPDQLKYFRKQRGLTQEDLANAIGINKKTYQSYEDGRVKPSIDTLLNLACFYGLYSIDELLGLTAIKEKTTEDLLQAYSAAGFEKQKIIDFILTLNAK